MVAVSMGALNDSGAMDGPGGEARTGALLRTTRRWYVLVFAALVLLYCFAPAARAVALGGLAVLSAGAIAHGTFVLRPQRWGAWLLVGLSVLLLGAGDTLTTLGGPVTQVQPGVTSTLYLITYVPLAIGLLGLGRPTLATRDWPTILDTISLSLAGALLFWIVLVRPAVVSLHLTGMGKVAAVATWVGYVAVLAACARLVLLWRGNRSAVTLAVGVAAFLISDFAYAHAVIVGHGVRNTIVERRIHRALRTRRGSRAAARHGPHRDPRAGVRQI